MGGCTKTTKQWQKVWTDKKYLAKKAAGAARKSASATGGGPSTAPSLSQWELKIISIMGDGFGEPQTSARVPAFHELVTPETPTAAPIQYSQENVSQQIDLPQHTEDPHTTSQQTSATPAGDVAIMRSQTTSSRRRREYRRHSPLAASSVRERLFELEERRAETEDRSSAELAGIRVAVVELCRLMQQIIEQLQSRRE